MIWKFFIENQQVTGKIIKLFVHSKKQTPSCCVKETCWNTAATSFRPRPQTSSSSRPFQICPRCFCANHQRHEVLSPGTAKRPENLCWQMLIKLLHWITETGLYDLQVSRNIMHYTHLYNKCINQVKLQMII